MKEKYIVPEIEIIVFSQDDIIMVSGVDALQSAIDDTEEIE